MDDEARRARIRQFVEAINTGKMEVFDALYHDDVVIHWPQSLAALSVAVGRPCPPVLTP